MIRAGEFFLGEDENTLIPRTRRRRRGAVSNSEGSIEQVIFGNTLGQDFVPIFVEDSPYLFRRIGEDILYRFPNGENGSSLGSYASIYGVLNNSNSIFKYYFEYKDTSGEIKVHRGMLMDKHENILFLLCIRKGVSKDAATFRDLKLLISNKLLETKYTNVYKKLLKDYFQPLMEEGAYVSYSSDIFREHVLNEKIKMDFQNLEDMTNKLSEAKELLDYNYNYELLNLANRKGYLDSSFDILPPHAVYIAPGDEGLYEAITEFGNIALNDTGIPSNFYDEPIDAVEALGGDLGTQVSGYVATPTPVWTDQQWTTVRDNHENNFMVEETVATTSTESTGMQIIDDEDGSVSETPGW